MTNEDTLNALNRILDLNRQRYAALNTIRNAQITKINRVVMRVDDSTKAVKIKDFNKFYRRKAKAAYTALNSDRLEAGLPMLENPFVKGNEQK